ncbi:MAG: thiamine pyrophosphate-binding protein [Chloroflexi bacterium]|nr:MAG: thiamine pyrophosphate-binding protein [Chloroflexota bacterium]
MTITAERRTRPRAGREAMVDQFAADGIRHVFGNPGTVEQGFLDAIDQHPDVEYILALQETVAVGIADGYARATRRPAVVQLHSGVGLGNGIGMLYQARRGHSPLVVIAGESGVRYDAMDSQMAADLVAMARPVTKWATRVVDPGSVLRVLRRAMKMAATPPMGPVFVALPMDVLDAPNEEAVVPTSFPVTRVAPALADVAAAADLLAGAQRPVVVAGDGVAAAGAQAELARVAETLGAEVWGADWSEVNLPATHPLFRGLLGHMFGDVSRAALAGADAILVCGTYVFPEVFPMLAGAFDPGARVVHVDLDAYEIAKNFPVDLGLVSDPAPTLAMLADALAARMDDGRRAAAAARAARIGEATRRERDAAVARDRAIDPGEPLRMAGFAADLAEQLPAGAIVFDEALTSSPDLTRYVRPETPGQYFLTRGGSLGVGIPGAIGCKLAYPDREVVGVTGDGGSMYTFQALWTAAHHGIGARFVICNNRSYELLKLNIDEYWRERDIPRHTFPASFDLFPPAIQFAELARALGVEGARVTSREQVRPVLRRALAHDGPFLIDVVIATGNDGVRSIPGGDRA